MSDLAQQIEALNQRLDSLEERLNTAQNQSRKALDMYRLIQIDDEGQFRQLYDEVQKIKQKLGLQ